MKSTAIIAMCFLFLVPNAAAFQDEEPALQEDASMQAYNKVTAKIGDKMKDFRKAYSAAKTKEAKSKVYDTAYPNNDDYAVDMWEVAKAHPKSEGGYMALSWLATRTRQGGHAEKALTAIGSDYATHAKVGDVCMSLARNSKYAAAKFLKNILEVNNDKNVQGKAHFALAKWNAGAVKTLSRLNGKDQKMIDRIEKSIGAETVTYLKATGSEALSAAALTHYEKVQSDYAEVAYGRRGGTLGKTAAGAVFELKNLAIGKTAPDIKGEDVDGVSFALSDYRGKVVVIDFWGDW